MATRWHPCFDYHRGWEASLGQSWHLWALVHARFCVPGSCIHSCLFQGWRSLCLRRSRRSGWCRCGPWTQWSHACFWSISERRLYRLVRTTKILNRSKTVLNFPVVTVRFCLVNPGADVEDKLWHEALPRCSAAAQPQGHRWPSASCDRHPPQSAPPSPSTAHRDSGQLNQGCKCLLSGILLNDRGITKVAAAKHDCPFSSADLSSSFRYEVQRSADHRVGPNSPRCHGKLASYTLLLGFQTSESDGSLFPFHLTESESNERCQTICACMATRWQCRPVFSLLLQQTGIINYHTYTRTHTRFRIILLCCSMALFPKYLIYKTLFNSETSYSLSNRCEHNRMYHIFTNL